MAENYIVGKITYKGDYGGRKHHEKVCTFPGIRYNQVVNETFQNALSAFTDANVKIVSCNYVFGVDDGDPGTDANVDKVLVVKLRDTTTQRAVKVSVAAPKDSVLEQGQHYERLKASKIADFLSFVNTYSLNTFTYLDSWVKQSR